MEDRAAQPHRPVGMGPRARHRPVGIAVDDLDPVEGNFQHPGDDLGKARLVPLARGLGADDHLDPAVGTYGDVGPLIGRGAGRFEIGDDADPGPLAALPGGGAPGGKALPVDLPQDGVEILAERAGIVCQPQPGPVGDRVGRDQVAPAERRPVHADLVGGEIDHAFDDLSHLGPSGAAIDRDGNRVGEHAPHRDVHRGYVVGRPGHLEEVGKDGERNGISAEIAQIVDPRRQYAVPGVERERAFGVDVARVVVGQEGVAPAAGPLDRAGASPGRPQQERILVAAGRADPEPAPDIAGDDPDPVGLHGEGRRDGVLEPVNALARRVQG